MDNEIESFTKKIARHLKDGEFGPQTVMGGCQDMLKRMASYYESEAEIETIETVPGLCRNPGLDLVRFDLKVPNFAFFPEHTLKIFGIKFPAARFTAFNTIGGETVSTSKLLPMFPGAVATFTGPTFKNGIPNNGLYTAEQGLVHPFGEPDSGRRGAFAISREGSLVTLTDEERKALLASPDDSVECIVGTSNIVLSSDTPDSLGQSPAGKTSLSYLTEFSNGGSKSDFVFFVTNSLFTRGTFKMVMDTYQAQGNYTDYRAVELEYTHSACFVRNDKGQMRFGGHGFATRKDHYLVIPNR